MSDKLSRSQILEDLPAYVLGALEPEEMLTIDRYLQHNSDPALLKRLQELEETVVELAYAVPDVSLPCSVKELLLERVAADLVVHHEYQNSGQQLSAPTISEELDLLSRVRMWLTKLFFGARPLTWVAVGALTVALLTGGVIYQLQHNLSQSQAESQALERELNQTLAQLEELQGDYKDLQLNLDELQQINQQLKQKLSNNLMQLAFLTNHPNQIVLLGTDEASTAKGSLFFSDEQGLLILDGLLPLPEEETYQLWLVPAEGSPESAGLIALSEKTINLHDILLPANPLDYAAFGISQEPAGGSDSPTEVIMLGMITQ